MQRFYISQEWHPKHPKNYKNDLHKCILKTHTSLTLKWKHHRDAHHTPINNNSTWNAKIMYFTRMAKSQSTESLQNHPAKFILNTIISRNLKWRHCRHGRHISTWKKKLNLKCQDYTLHQIQKQEEIDSKHEKDRHPPPTRTAYANINFWIE